MMYRLVPSISQNIVCQPPIRRQAELWYIYELTRAFFFKHMDDLNKTARESIKTMEQARAERVKAKTKISK